MTPSSVAEIVQFRLAGGVTVEAFRAAAAASQTVLAAVPGYAGRCLSCDDTGLWTDHVLWESSALATAAAEVVMQDSRVRPFVAAIAPEGMTMRHAAVVLVG